MDPFPQQLILYQLSGEPLGSRSSLRRFLLGQIPVGQPVRAQIVTFVDAFLVVARDQGHGEIAAQVAEIRASLLGSEDQEGPATQCDRLIAAVKQAGIGRPQWAAACLCSERHLGRLLTLARTDAETAQRLLSGARLAADAARLVPAKRAAIDQLADKRLTRMGEILRPLASESAVVFMLGVEGCLLVTPCASARTVRLPAMPAHIVEALELEQQRDSIVSQRGTRVDTAALALQRWLAKEVHQAELRRLARILQSSSDDLDPALIIDASTRFAGVAWRALASAIEPTATPMIVRTGFETLDVDPRREMREVREFTILLAIDWTATHTVVSSAAAMVVLPFARRIRVLQRNWPVTLVIAWGRVAVARAIEETAPDLVIDLSDPSSPASIYANGGPGRMPLELWCRSVRHAPLAILTQVIGRQQPAAPVSWLPKLYCSDATSKASSFSEVAETVAVELLCGRSVFRAFGAGHRRGRTRSESGGSTGFDAVVPAHALGWRWEGGIHGRPVDNASDASRFKLYGLPAGLEADLRRSLEGSAAEPTAAPFRQWPQGADAEGTPLSELTTPVARVYLAALDHARPFTLHWMCGTTNLNPEAVGHALSELQGLALLQEDVVKSVWMLNGTSGSARLAQR